MSSELNFTCSLCVVCRPYIFEFIKYLWNTEANFPGYITCICVVYAVVSICEMMTMFTFGLAYF